MHTEEQEHWTAKDLIPGAAFTALGLLVTLYAFLAMRNGVPVVLWALAWVVGPVLLLMGGHATYSGIRSFRRDREST